jgi:eukaryotic-like serine/threonine-protein kinase
MTPDRWTRIKEVLSAACELPADARRQYLDEACRGDSTLREEVECLLDGFDGSTDFLQPCDFPRDIESLVTSDSWLGRRLGPYELVEEIAHGGMGAVFRAVRTDEYHQHVAIKLAPGGFRSAAILDRFRSERQILASLEHSNIARLLDGGTTEDGVPFLVMEYIAGEPINAYCDRRRLSLLDRVLLFRAVCSAVQYSHQHLVVHRDIKPGNILVTPDGVPKLLDFGIAKLLDSDFGQRSVTQLRMMTPEYASPEQVRGEAIALASDVYSLGVVLYELLTGHHPYRLAKRLPHEVAHAICEQEPERPSSAVLRVEDYVQESGETALITPETVSGARAIDPGKLRRRLQGDLDTVLLKALQKQPLHRYATVEQFSDDLRRFLEGRPVHARLSTPLYRAGKFIRRRKTAVAAAMMAALALGIGVTMTVREAGVARVQRARAEQQFNDVRELATSLVFDIHDAIRDLPGATPARKLLVSRAVRSLDKLAAEANGDIGLQRELAAAYERLGDVQGSPVRSNLGEREDALVSYRKALAIRASLAAREPGSIEPQRNLAADFARLAACAGAAGNYRIALSRYSQALAVDQRIATNHHDPDLLNELAGDYRMVGYELQLSGDGNAPLENLQKSIAIRQSIVAANPDPTGRFRSGLAQSYATMAYLLMLHGQPDRSVKMQEEAVDASRAVARSQPDREGLLEVRCGTEYYYGFLLEQKGDFSKALAAYQEAVADYRSLARDDPENTLVRRYLGFSYRGLGAMQVRRGSAERSLQNLQKALALFKSLPMPSGGDIYVESGLADSYAGLGNAFVALASSPGVSIAQRIQRLQTARADLQKSLYIWLEMQKHTKLGFFDQFKPAKLNAAIARCNTALDAPAIARVVR